MKFMTSPGTLLFAVILLHPALAEAQSPGGDLIERSDRDGQQSRDEMPEPARDRHYEINDDGSVNEPVEFTMFERAGHMIDILGNQSPEAFIGALFLALLIALATAAAHRRLARHKPDASTRLVSLIFLANLVCILAAFSFAQLTVPTARVIVRSGQPPRDRMFDGHDHFSPPDGSGASSARHPR